MTYATNLDALEEGSPIVVAEAFKTDRSTWVVRTDGQDHKQVRGKGNARTDLAALAQRVLFARDKDGAS